MSFRPEVLVINDSKWYDNGVRFATRAEAESYASNLAGRWTAVRRHRAVECDDKITHRWLGDRSVRIEEVN